MSDFDVYEGEMTNNRFSDRDIERFFSGQIPEDEVLAKLTPLVGMLRAHNTHRLSEERVTDFAAEAGKLATTTRLHEAGSAAHQGTVSQLRRFNLTLKRKLATGLASVLVLSGMTGVAVASNGATPGDTLYGLDQALEAVGIGDGAAAERIEEAQSLFNDGLVAEAISHAAEAVAQTEDAESFSPESAKAAEALQGAAESVLADGDEESEDVRIAVADLLSQMAGWIADPALDGRTLGENVSTLAKEIAGAPDELPDAADNAADEAEAAEENAEEAGGSAEESGPPEDVPTGPPADVPGRP